jgi:phosphatidylinositol alpha-1,6-mannosyltransferase
MTLSREALARRSECRGIPPLRMLLLTSEFPPGPGGIGTHAYQLASGLSRLGWGVRVLTSQDYATESEVTAFNRGQPFPIVRFRRIAGPPVEAVYREIVLMRHIRAQLPDIIVASGSRAILLAAARWAGTRSPWVAIAHGSEFCGCSGWQSRAVRTAFGRATAVVFVSEYTRRHLHAAGVRTRADHVVPNGADSVRFRVLPEAESISIRTELGLPQGPLLVTLGNVTERKGQDVVVRALPAIHDRVPAVHYAIVGLPTLGEKIRRLAKELGVADHVHLLGRLDDARVVRLLNAADLFVMTSRRTADGDVEGYGIAVVEAALCGKPAVVSADSGLVEAVEEGRTAVVVPQDDPTATAEAVMSLLVNDSRRLRMGELARLRAEGEQTWPGRVQRYDDLLRELVAGSPRNQARAT